MKIMRRSGHGMGIKYWLQLFLFPIYWFSFLIPRNKHIWLFGSTWGRRFADNPRYFYLYLSQHKKDHQNAVRPVWIGHDRSIIRILNEMGYEAYYNHSLKGIWYCLRGKVYFYDNYPKDISQWLSGGAVKVNLWHGAPLKKIQMDNIHDKVRYPDRRVDKLRYALRRFTDEKPSHFILSPSDFFAPIFSSAFATQKVLTTGFPRTDVFTGEQIHNVLLDSERDTYNKIKELKKEKKIFLYMPTFRDSETKFFDVMRMEEFERYLRENNYLFCTKLHCKSKLRKEFESIAGEHVILIDPNADPYVFVGLSDVLITDYSSIYFDYLLTGKPILFFDYDLEEYLSRSREMYFDYEAFTPGHKAATMEELQKLMRRTEESGYGQELYKKRAEILEKAFGHDGKNSCERLKDAVMHRILRCQERKEEHE